MCRELGYLKSDYPLRTITIIHGGARGADQLAGTIAELWRWPVEVYEADWDKHGKGAGPIRNKQMLDEGKPDLILAFPMLVSKGTWDMIRQGVRAGVEVRIFSK
jgi:hypothetical protein